MKTIIDNTTKVMRTIVATLVILVALCGVSKGTNSGKECTQENNELAIQVKTWMGNTTYWNDESDSNVQDLANQMKSWMGNSNFWSSEGDNDVQELASRIKLWMKSKTYLTDSDEQFITGNELAKN